MSVSLIDGHIDEPKDLVEVVRCKNCEHYKPQSISSRYNSTTPYCRRTVSVKVNENDYCSFGVRKESEVTE